MTEKPKVGRPTDYSVEIATKICEALAEGRSLRAICEAEDMPGKTTVFRWLAAHEEFRDQYARAREAQAELLADEIIEIADDGRNDYRNVAGDDEDDPPVQVVDHEHISRSKLRVDARKWFAGKVAPKKYGERMQTEHSGTIGVKATAETSEEVRGKITDIFGADVPKAAAPAKPPRGNRVVRRKARKGR